MKTVSDRLSERVGIRTLCDGEAVAILECLDAVNLSRNVKVSALGDTAGGQGNTWKRVHGRPPGISRSQARSSEDLHPPWTSGCKERVNARGRRPRGGLPEEDVGGIPEDYWDADNGPGSHPGICLGVADHVVIGRCFGSKFPRTSTAECWSSALQGAIKACGLSLPHPRNPPPLSLGQRCVSSPSPLLSSPLSPPFPSPPQSVPPHSRTRATCSLFPSADTTGSG